MEHKKEFLLRTIGSYMGRIATSKTTEELQNVVERMNKDIDFIVTKK